MGIHSPFDYVGYEWQMPKLACDILELLCHYCHTNRDYDEGCHGCPAGIMFFACKDYVLEAQEEDKHYHHYTTKDWLDKREKMYGKRDLPEEVARWQAMADYHKPEAEAIRRLKRLFKDLEPRPYWENRGEYIKFDFTKHREAIESIKTFKDTMMAGIREGLKSFETK